MRLKKTLYLFFAAALVGVSMLACAETVEPVENETAEMMVVETTAAQLAVPKDEYILNFGVTPEGAGYLSGIASQTLRKGEKSTTVEAVASPGYTFVKWSDGEKDAIHKPMTVSESQTVYAIFEQSIDSCPVIYITTENGVDVQSDWQYINCTISVDNIEKRYVVNEAQATIKCRGNASMGWPKKSYTLKFAESQKLGGLGEGKSKNWVLVSNHCDQSLLRNHAAFWLQRNMDGIEWAPDCRPVDVYLNGSYRGSYMLIEKVTVNENRVNIVNGKENPAVDADFMVELDNYAYKAGDNGIVWFTAKSFPYEIRGEDNLTAERCAYIDQWVTDAYVTACDGTEEEIRAVLDIDSLIDTYLVEEIMKNIDCGWSSFFLYRRDGKLYFGPGWDFDLAAGNDYRLDNGDYKGLYAGLSNGFGQQNPWFLRLMEKEWFRKEAAARFFELEEKGIFDKMFIELDNVYAVCAESFEHNFEKWPIFGQRMNMETDLILSFDTVEEHFNYLKEWLGNRLLWLYDEYEKILGE
ncbi:MAG: CotH kinase family protein [Eubacteriales bacterium]